MKNAMYRCAKPRQGAKACHGVSMVEVLVTMVVIAVGLLGVAGLQATGMRNNYSAYLRSQATVLASDMADRMRSNGEAFSNGNAFYDNPAATQFAACLTTTGCSAQEMAQNDFYMWNEALNVRLPAAVGAVCIDSTPNDGTSAGAACDGVGDLYAVKIWWDDTRSGKAEQRFVSLLQPRLY